MSGAALVTGAGGAIGSAIARRLAAQGTSVLLADISETACDEAVAAIQARGDVASTTMCDVTSTASVEAAVSCCVEQYGSLDVLVCAAAVLRDGGLENMPDEDWDSVIDVSLRGSFLCSRAAAPYMRSQGGGKIILFSSTSARGNIEQLNYVAAKAGVEGLVRGLALELGPSNVNVNGVAPGFIRSAMTAALAHRLGMNLDELADRAARLIPLRRVGRPEDIANVVAFLASEDASFVTGQVVYATGGAVASTARSGPE